MIRLVDANNKFGFKLFSEIQKSQSNKNVFVSPISIAIALSMTYNGAGGETQEAMAKTLNFQGMSLEEINQANKELGILLNNLKYSKYSMKKNSLTLSLPEWIDDFLKQYQFPLVSNEERMRFVLKLTLQNIEKTTGGPFGAAVFERESGQLVSVGVNVVLKQGCSAAHAEMMAIMLAQQELGTHDLGIADLPEFQLVTSGKMCAMCLGSVVWSGVREVLASAQPEDVENIVGFDEGPAPADYDQQLEKRGISIIPSFLREEGCEVLQRYVDLEGVVYNPSRNS